MNLRDFKFLADISPFDQQNASLVGETPTSSEKEFNLPDKEITFITDDTRKVCSGCIFVAIKGRNFDSHLLALECEQKGACLIVCERDTGAKNQVIVSDSRKAFSLLNKEFYNNPTKDLTLFAVTGTNGKTTVVNLLKQILILQGETAGSIGTIGYDTGKTVYDAYYTTPPANELYKIFRETADNNVKFCAIEASSQSIDQKRFSGETFSFGVFTNLTGDHLDWHGNMDNYFLAKKSLFDFCENSVVCLDTEYGKQLCSYNHKNLITYSIRDSSAFYYAKDIFTESSEFLKNNFTIVSKKFGEVKCSLKMIGEYNIANAIAAVAVLSEYGFPFKDCGEALAKISGVPGRCEVIYDKEFTVIRDYAHTDDGLKKFLSEIKKQSNNRRIITLFGAAGERDAIKRPRMGEIVSKFSDFFIVTSDNPRNEDPQEIINDVLKGSISKDHFVTFVDRFDAIKYALMIAKKNDIILLCGKGHETYQAIKDNYLPFDEKKIVLGLLESGVYSST